MKPITKVMTVFTLGILLQRRYLLLFRSNICLHQLRILAWLVKVKRQTIISLISKEGNKYFSYDRKYMAVVTEKSIQYLHLAGYSC